MCRDQDEMPAMMTPDYGVGVSFSDDKGERYTTLIREQRRLYVDITSYRGISCGAIHYYAKIWFPDPELQVESSGKILSIGGVFDRHKPTECQSKPTELVRILTQKEIDDDPIRWEYYYAGWEANGFEDIDELKEAVAFVIKHRFPGDWKIVMND